MDTKPVWNPLTEWKHTDIQWVRVDISRGALNRFATRGTPRGLLQAVGFLLLIGAAGALACLSFINRYWALLVLALYVHGTFYSFFGNALHELSHTTVFAHRTLNAAVTALFGRSSGARQERVLRVRRMHIPKPASLRHRRGRPGGHADP
jgi:hypothetical protein